LPSHLTGSTISINLEIQPVNRDKELDARRTAETEKSSSSVQSRVVKTKLTRVLPTDRVGFERQLEILRAYAVASGHEKKTVNNGQVAAILSGIVPSSISLCNQFFSDCGALVAEGRKQLPSDAVFDYQQAYEWDPETAGQKLHSIFSRTWGAKVLLPRLSFRSLSREEAIGFLAEESRAQKAHRRRLSVLLEFLNAAGVVEIDGNVVSRGQLNGNHEQSSNEPPAVDSNQPRSIDTVDEGKHADLSPPNIERFSIPIPGKEGAVISVPKDLEAEDWDMLSVMIETYIRRLRGASIKGKSS
jgi:hypothetical protein